MILAEWPPFGKELHIRLTVCSLCIPSICTFGVSQCGFEGGTVVLIAPVPGHCLPFFKRKIHTCISRLVMVLFMFAK